ncbi:MAG: CBU_0592 family membrane protein [Gaiellaceae bacterium]
MAQLAQVVGALLILAAYALAQFGALNQRSYWYIGLNLVGATALAILAWHEEQWGFLLLEGVWALVSAVALVTRVRRPQPSP